MAGGRGPPTRCRGTTVLAHWHTLGSARLPENYTVARVDRSVVAAAAAVRYFDTVDTRLISIRYGRRGTNCRTKTATPVFFLSSRCDPDTIRGLISAFPSPGISLEDASFFGLQFSIQVTIEGERRLEKLAKLR